MPLCFVEISPAIKHYRLSYELPLFHKLDSTIQDWFIRPVLFSIDELFILAPDDLSLCLILLMKTVQEVMSFHQKQVLAY